MITQHKQSLGFSFAERVLKKFKTGDFKEFKCKEQFLSLSLKNLILLRINIER